MMDTNKKISFGFNKLVRKPMVVRTQPVEEKKVELVDCLEGQSIKIKDAVEIVDEPLVIPIKDNKYNLLDRIKEARAKQKEPQPKVKQEDIKNESELTLDELAARELINDAKNRLENTPVSDNKVTVLPIKEDKITIEGEEEATLEDYENVPISDYGLAMLRGMGWKEGMGIGKNPTKIATATAPELRPKGLGLGATKIIQTEKPVSDKDGKALILKRGTYAKIIAGSHKGNYCEVQGLDDEAGRVIVRTSLKEEILTLNEFLLVPVTKEEYNQSAKVLNNAKYEEYKEMSERKLEAQKKIQSRSNKKGSDNESPERELVSKRKHSSSLKKEYASDCDDNVKLEKESKRKSRDRIISVSDDDEEDKSERHKSKHKGKQMHSSDSDDKYKKSKSRYRDSSDSDSQSRKKSKDKKKNKDRDKRRQKSDKKKSSRSRDRSRSYDRDYKKRESSKKHKSKSKHRSKSNSSSSSSNSTSKNDSRRRR